MAKPLVILGILCVLFVAAVKGFDKNAAMAKFMAQLDECKKEIGAKEADIGELIAKKPASTMEGKCLRSCIMKKYKVMDNNGKFVKEVAVSHAKEYTDGAEDKMKISHEIIDTCANIVVSNDHCEAAEQYGKCFVEQVEAHGLKDFY